MPNVPLTTCIHENPLVRSRPGGGNIGYDRPGRVKGDIDAHIQEQRHHDRNGKNAEPVEWLIKSSLGRASSRTQDPSNDDIGFSPAPMNQLLSLINPTIGWAMMPDNGLPARPGPHLQYTNCIGA